MAATAEPLEDFVARAVLYRLDTPQLARALTKARKSNLEHDQLASQVTDDQAMLEQLATDYAAKTITHPEWLAARKPIQARIDATKRRLSRISPTHRIDEFAGHSAALGEAWADLPLTRQTAIIRTVLDHLVVNPATPGRNRFDQDRFSPVWRL